MTPFSLPSFLLGVAFAAIGVVILLASRILRGPAATTDNDERNPILSPQPAPTVEAGKAWKSSKLPSTFETRDLVRDYLSATPDAREKYLEGVFASNIEPESLSQVFVRLGLQPLVYDLHRQFPSISMCWEAAWVLVQDPALSSDDQVLEKAIKTFDEHGPISLEYVTAHSRIYVDEWLEKLISIEQWGHIFGRVSVEMYANRLLELRQYRLFARWMEQTIDHHDIYREDLEKKGLSYHELLRLAGRS